MKANMTLNKIPIFEKILAERGRQDDKWGADRMLDNYEWHTILSEETGECAKAVNQDRPQDELGAELVQVAAVAVAWLECLQHREKIK